MSDNTGSNMGSCDFDALDAVVKGTAGTATPELTAHVAGCSECRTELRWRQEEQALMARRRLKDAPLPPLLWQGVAARIEAPAASTSLVEARQRRQERERNRWASVSTAVYGLAAAAGLLFMLRGPLGLHRPTVAPIAPVPVDHPVPDGTSVARRRPRLAPDVALAQAEHEYQDAVAVLEAEYRQERGLLPAATAVRYDRTFQKTRDAVAQARAAIATGPAGHDLDARISLLDGYADYAQSLQEVVSDLKRKKRP